MTSVLQMNGVRLDVPSRTLFTKVNLSLSQGESVALVGASGAGKTTLVNCAAGILMPTEGTVYVGDVEFTALKPAARSALRLRSIGMIFQFSDLLPELSVVDNVALPLRFGGTAKAEARKKAESQIERLGLGGLHRAQVGNLSGGERQRVGIARATVASPRLILADEPTGMLDNANTDSVMKLLLDEVAAQGCALLLATHDSRVANMLDRTVAVDDAKLVDRKLAS